MYSYPQRHWKPTNIRRFQGLLRQGSLPLICTLKLLFAGSFENTPALGLRSSVVRMKPSMYLPSQNIIPAHLPMLSRPQYLPPKWAEYINPEGNLYYARNSVPRVVTDAYMPNPNVQDQIQSMIEAFEVAVCKEQILLPQSAELFLEPSVSGPCLYYLVDHAIRVVFWIYPTATENLSLHPVVSDSHLSAYSWVHRVDLVFMHFVEIQLEALYWQHVEFFPAHPVDNFNLMLDNLTDVLIQGRAGSHLDPNWLGWGTHISLQMA